MKKIVLFAFAALALMSTTGCKKKGGGMVAAYKTYVDEVCACVDKKDKAAECQKAATDKYMKENTKDGKAEQPSADEAAAFAKETADITKKFGECQAKIAAAATAGAGDMKKEEPKKEEPKAEEKKEEKKEEPKAEEKKEEKKEEEKK